MSDPLIETFLVALSKKEQHVYDSVEAEAQQAFSFDTAQLQSAVSHMLQACNSLDLCLFNCAMVSPTEFQDMIRKPLREFEKQEATPCSFCRVVLSKRDVLRAHNRPEKRMKFSEEEAFTSSKISALLDLLRKSTCGKSVVLSEFENLLLMADRVLLKAGFHSGCMGVVDADKLTMARTVVEDFSNAEHHSVLLTTFSALLSTPGLNLSAVSGVYMIGPSWNASSEKKVLGLIRQHRTRKNDGGLKVVRFVCQNSIEERMMGMRNSKADIKQLFGLT